MNPPCGVNVNEIVVGLPGITVDEAAAETKLKSAPEIVSVRVEEVLTLKLALPAYVQVIACAPVASVEVERVATPELSVTPPIDVVPSRQVTLPVGVPALDETVMVSVTGAPEVAGLGEAETVVVLAAALTTNETCVVTGA